MFKEIKVKAHHFLRKTQKYTETDMIYLTKGGFWLTLSKIVTTLASFSLSIAFANLLDPVVYGNYRYVLSLAGILGIFSLNGMGAAITQAVSRNLEGSFYRVFEVKLKWSLLGSLSSLGLAAYYFLRGNYILPIPLLISATFLPVLNASYIYENFLVGKKYFATNTRYNIIRKIFYLTSMVGALLLTKNLFWLIAVYFISATIPNFFLYNLTKIKLKPNKKEDPETVSYGKHLSLMGVIGTISSYIDRFLIFHYFGAVNLAVYHFAIIIPQEIKGFLSTVNILALPKLSIKTKEDIKNHLIGKLKLLFLLIAILVLIYILIAPLVYKVFFPKYLQSIPYSQVYILSFFGFPASLLITSFRAKKIKKELYQFKIITPLLKIILFLILIPPFGIWGLVMVEIGIGLFAFGLTLFLFKKI